MGNRSCPRVRFVLALDRGRIRNLIPVPPPETDGELLDFALIVVANKNLGVVADVVIDTGRPLAVVLPEDFRLDVIVGTQRCRCRVRGGEQLCQGQHVGVNTFSVGRTATGRNRRTPESRLSSRCQLPRNFIRGGQNSFLIDLGWREIPG